MIQIPPLRSPGSLGPGPPTFFFLSDFRNLQKLTFLDIVFQNFAKFYSGLYKLPSFLCLFSSSLWVFPCLASALASCFLLSLPFSPLIVFRKNAPEPTMSNAFKLLRTTVSKQKSNTINKLVVNNTKPKPFYQPKFDISYSSRTQTDYLLLGVVSSGGYHCSCWYVCV